MPHPHTIRRGDLPHLIRSALVMAGLIAALLVFAALLAGCKAVPKSPELSTTATAASAVSDMELARGEAQATRKSVAELTAENLPTVKPVALTHADATLSHLSRGIDHGRQAVKQAERDAKTMDRQESRIAELEADDSTRTLLGRIGVGLIVLAVLVSVLAVWRGLWHLLIPAGLGAASGFALVFVAMYLKTLAWLFGGAFAALALAALGLVVYLAWGWWRTHSAAGSIVQSIQTAKDAALLGWSKAAAVVADGVQTPTAKKLVQAFKPGKAGDP